MSDPDCIFCKIVGGQIPADIILHNDRVTAFRDVNPQMPVHMLVVPNQHLADSAALTAEHDLMLGALLRAASEVARQAGLAERGYRLVINTGADSGNSVPHLHLHILGGRSMGWPPG